MKKTAQIVTIPLDKEGWSKGDLIDNGSLGYSLAPYDNKTGIDDWQAQQLLVLSDDEIQAGDWYYEPSERIGKMQYIWICQSEECNGKKIIASYPVLEYFEIKNTLPISKETVQAWIDAGMPDSAKVEMVNEYAIDGHTIVGAANSLDEQGNLLLQFSSTKDAEDKALIEEAFKPKQVPTDEDIAFFAKEYIKFQEPQSFYNTYIDSYKQALKDMGYE